MCRNFLGVLAGMEPKETVQFTTAAFVFKPFIKGDILRLTTISRSQLLLGVLSAKFTLF